MAASKGVCAPRVTHVSLHVVETELVDSPFTASGESRQEEDHGSVEGGMPRKEEAQQREVGPLEDPLQVLAQGWCLSSLLSEAQTHF